MEIAYISNARAVLHGEKIGRVTLELEEESMSNTKKHQGR